MFHRGNGCCFLGVLAVALGSGILIAAIFPTGAMLFLVAFLFNCMRLRLLQTVINLFGGEFMNIVVWKSPKALEGILRRLFKLPKA